MASISSIQAMAQELGLWNIAKGNVDLQNERLSNLDYLSLVLSQEIDCRNQKRNAYYRKASRIPRKVFDPLLMSKGMQWQLERMLSLEWIEDEQNIIILGGCHTGKTSLASHLGNRAIDLGYKTYYATFDHIISVVKQQETLSKAKRTLQYMRECDLLIIDDFLYVDPTREELHLFYRAMTFFNESRSMIFITNREVSIWKNASDDIHLMQTMTDRITIGSQLLRMTD